MTWSGWARSPDECPRSPETDRVRRQGPCSQGSCGNFFDAREHRALAWTTCSAIRPSPVPATRSPSSRPRRRCRRRSRHRTSWGVRRLQEEYGVEVVEYPTTRVVSPPAARAADVNAAFADPEISAIVASIGGNDQIKILRHLDAEVIAANPKPFFGVSDNTNLHNYLWNLGIVSYYGGAVMVELGRAGSLNPHTGEAFRAALLGDGWYDLRPAETLHRHQPRLGRPGEPRARAGDAARHRLGVARRLAVRGGSALGRLPRDRRLQPAGRALPRAGRRGVRRVRAVPRDDRGAADRAVRRRGADVHGRAWPAAAVLGAC